MSRRSGWFAALAVLIAVRTAIPLVVLIAEGHKLPRLRRYDYVPLPGDAAGFYSTARELIAALRRLTAPGLIALALVLALVVAGVLRVARRRSLARHWTLVSVAGAVSLAVAFVVTQMTASGAAVFGWPLVWSLPMLPLRVVGALDPDSAFAVGLPLALAANAVTLVATAYCGRYATGRANLGLAAAGAYAVWPLVTPALTGTSESDNGTWIVDLGLAMYSEPLSTALMTAALALVLAPHRSPTMLSLAGLLLGCATLTKVSNGLLALVFVGALLAWNGVRPTLPLVAGGLVAVPVLIAYWPLGYPKIQGTTAARPDTVDSATDALHNWTQSLLFSPKTLLVLVPIAALGVAATASARTRTLLVLPILLNAAIYTVYKYTADNPRFLLVSLPPLFVLWFAGGHAIVRATAIRASSPVRPLLARHERPHGGDG